MSTTSGRKPAEPPVGTIYGGLEILGVGEWVAIPTTTNPKHRHRQWRVKCVHCEKVYDACSSNVKRNRGGCQRCRCTTRKVKKPSSIEICRPEFL